MPRCPHCGESHGPEFHFCGKTGQPLDLGPRLIGQVLLDRYQVVNLLGEGPVGAVLEVEQAVEGGRERLAAKMLHPRFARDKESVRQFLEEAERAGKSGHPHIARVFATGRDTGGAPLVVREFMEGESLDSYVASSAPLPVDDAVRITRQILDGLAAAHAVSVANLDLSPGDVFLVRGAAGALEPKLVDFGEAHLKKAIGREAVTRSAPYFAPENALGGEPDERADLWATATMLHQMLTGQLPFGEAPDWSASTSPRPTPARKVRPDVEPLLEAVLLKALSVDPSRRYPDAAAFEAALARAVGARPSLSAPPPKPAPAAEEEAPPANAAAPAPAPAEAVAAKAQPPAPAPAAPAPAPAKPSEPPAAKAAEGPPPAKAAAPAPAPAKPSEPPAAKAAEGPAPAKAEEPAAPAEAKAAAPAAPAAPARTGTLRLGEALDKNGRAEAVATEAETAPTQRLQAVGKAAPKPAPRPAAAEPRRARPAPPADEDLSVMIHRRPVWPILAGVGVVVVIIVAIVLVPGLLGGGGSPDGSTAEGPVGAGAPSPLVDPEPATEPEPEPPPPPATPDAAAEVEADAAEAHEADAAAEPEPEPVAPEPEPAEPEPVAPAPPAPQMVRISIRATPADATITIDGAAVGSNPYETEVEASSGTHLIRVTAEGFRPDARRVAFDRDRSVTVALTAEPARPAGGGARPGGGAVGGSRPGAGGAPTKTTGGGRPGGTRPGAGGFQSDNPFD